MDNWTHSIVSRAVGEVVSLASVKNNLDITTNEFDSLLADHIAAAIGYVEDYTSRFLLPTVVQVFTDRLAIPLRLPFAPIVEFTSMTVAGEPFIPRVAALDSLLPPLGQRWPYLATEIGAVSVTYSAGYALGQVPEVIKQAVKIVVGIYYDKPEARAAAGEWDAVHNLLARQRVRTL